jgi:hypothetical protein
MFIDLGRWGDNHMNEDQLNVEVFAYGRPFLTNSGRWRYTTSDPIAPWMPWARYFKTTASYNCVLVDGFLQINGDADGYMKVYEKYDYAEGWFDTGFGIDVADIDEQELKDKGIAQKKIKKLDATHSRKVIFVKKPVLSEAEGPDFWIVRDEVFAKGEHEAEQVWHYYDGDLKQNGDAWVTQFDDANLILQTIGQNMVVPTYYKGSDDPIAGWHCPYYDIKRPAPELRLKQTGNDKIVFHTLLFPVQGKVDTFPTFEVTDGGYKVSFAVNTWIIKAPSVGEWKLV